MFVIFIFGIVYSNFNFIKYRYGQMIFNKLDTISYVVEYVKKTNFNPSNVKDPKTFTEEEIKEIEDSEKEEDLNDDIDNDTNEIENENEVNKYLIFENKVKVYNEKINLYKNLIKEYEEFKMGKSKLDAKDTSYLEEKTNNLLNIIESINNLRNLINNF